jgi:hypothetical protein
MKFIAITNIFNPSKKNTLTWKDKNRSVRYVYD